jgi:hypothetical protein
MFVESKKYVKPGGSSCVSFAYSLESEGRSDMVFGEIVILRHFLNTVAAQIAVGDNICRDTSARYDRPPEANLRVHGDGSIVVLCDRDISRRSNARVKHKYTVGSTMDATQQISNNGIKRPLTSRRNVYPSALMDDIYALIRSNGEFFFDKRMCHRNIRQKELESRSHAQHRDFMFSPEFRHDVSFDQIEE